MTPPSRHSFVPFLAAFAGVALFSCMDAVMKSLSLAIGAYNALFWRSLLGTLIGGVAMVVMRYHIPRWNVLDRKSVVSGKSVSVRVDLGGRRFIQNKIQQA